MDDVFISYNRADAAWADRLRIDLEGLNYSVFLDTSRLKAGDEWDSKLQHAIANARNLVVLWSPHAATSQWVSMEMAYFERARADDSTRRHIHLNLEGQSKVFGRLEAINDLRDANAYAKPPADVNLAVWREVLRKLEDVISQAGTITVCVVTLTSTLERLTAIKLDATQRLAPPYRETLEALGLKQPDDDAGAWQRTLAEFYGSRRSDWKPFGGSRSINEILDALRVEVLRRQAVPAFRWRHMSDAFWSGSAPTVLSEAEKLSTEYFVVVVDSLSLYDEQVLSRLDTLRIRLHDRSGVIVLAPYARPRAAAHFRLLFQYSSEELYRWFYRLPVPSALRGQINLCEDDLDIGRLVTTVLPLPSGDAVRHPAITP